MRPVFPDYLSFSYDYEYKEIFKCLRRECIDHKIKFLFLYRLKRNHSISLNNIEPSL